MSQSNCSGVNVLASTELRDQEKCPSSTCFVRRRNSFRSQRSPLILLERLPQKRNKERQMVPLLDDGSKGIHAIAHICVAADHIDSGEGGRIRIPKHGAGP